MASTPSDRTPASKEGLHTPSEAGSATQTLAGGLPKDEEKGYTSKGGSPSFNATTKLAFSKLIPAGISLQLVFWCAPSFTPRLKMMADRFLSFLFLACFDFPHSQQDLRLVALWNALQYVNKGTQPSHRRRRL